MCFSWSFEKRRELQTSLWVCSLFPLLGSSAAVNFSSGHRFSGWWWRISSSSPFSGKVTTAEMIRLVFLAMAHAALPMLGVLSREGRWTWTDAVVTKENWRPEMRKMRLCLEDSFGQIVSFFWG